jgi:hypothetical protein
MACRVISVGGRIMVTTNVPEAQKRRSPSRIPSRTYIRGKHVSSAAPGNINGAQWLPIVPA